jgi:hypothetical protein
MKQAKTPAETAQRKWTTAARRVSSAPEIITGIVSAMPPMAARGGVGDTHSCQGTLTG